MSAGSFRRDRIPDENILHEIRAHALIADHEDERRDRHLGRRALRRFDGAAERTLRVAARHPFAQHRDVARRRGPLSRWADLGSEGLAREVDVLGERRHHIVGTHAGRHAIVVADVEARPALEALLRDPLLLLLLRPLALDVDAAVLALAPFAQLVEIALQLAPAVAIGLFLHALLETLLALALVHVRDVDRGARVVAEGSEPAAGELEFDQILLHLDERHGNLVAATNAGAVLLQAVAELLDATAPRRAACHFN